VITHPERNPLLAARPELLAEWVGDGCYLQVTAQSLTGHFGAKARDFAEALLKRGLVHFVASDGHDPERRPPRLDTAFEYLCRKYSPEAARRLCVDNPRAALEGEPLAAGGAAGPPDRRSWYRFW
jgi:protein-tyrosine phosphatase